MSDFTDRTVQSELWSIKRIKENADRESAEKLAAPFNALRDRFDAVHSRAYEAIPEETELRSFLTRSAIMLSNMASRTATDVARNANNEALVDSAISMSDNFEKFADFIDETLAAVEQQAETATEQVAA